MPAPSDLFAAIAATWPPVETRRLGAWTLRRGGDGGNRVSAASLEDGACVSAAGLDGGACVSAADLAGRNPVSAAGLDGASGGIEAAEAAMRAWGQSPLVIVRPGQAALDAALGARGYALRDASRLLAGDAAALAGDGPPPETAADCEAPLACMAPIWQAGGVGPGRRAIMDRVAGPKAWLLGRLGEAPAACGFVALDGEVAMLHALEVAAPARGKGLGALLTRAAAFWARVRGATTLALAVTEANAPARALYARLGLVEAARYHYRAAD